MKKILLYISFAFCCLSAKAQSDILWQKVSSSSLARKANTSETSKLYYKLNADLLGSKLASVVSKTAKSTSSEITIPNTDGNLERFSVWESSNFDPELQAKYPEIRAYEGRGIDDKNAKIYFSVAPIGIQTMVFRVAKPTEYIEQNPDDKSEYVLFKSADNAESKMRLDCKTVNVVSQNKTSITAKTASNTQQLKTFRLALSCTGEYATYFGGTKAGALAGMNATLSRVNGVFEKDLSVKVVLIANNDAVIYTDASTDPYSNASAGTADPGGTWGQEVQTTLTNVIGNANYDIGHLFGGSGGGGNANCIGCVCENPTASEPLAKGSAYTSPADAKPEGDTFDIDFVAHEMGHQLGGTHTFSHASEGTGTQYEPGSGSTIMGYAGVTRNYDVQSNSDDYFSYGSINQIQNNLAGKTCPVTTAIANNPPVIDAGSNYTIPISTPFVLTGTGSDPENDEITYTWEQFDSATTAFGANSIAYATKPDGPMFRSLAPTTSPVRYMPALSSVLNNQLTTTWESVSSIAKTMNFTLTGRDNAAEGPQTNTDAMVVTVSASAGPFAVTSQNSDNIGWPKGSTQTVTWSVNNTNTLQGSSEVNIKLSLDGGLTFPVTLAANTPNDGSETVLVPTGIDASTNCRLLIEPVNNIYYAVNSTPFAIGYTVSTDCASYSFGSSYAITYGTSYINKTLAVPASSGVVSDVNVSVNVTHARFSDLEMQIVSPSGTIVTLFNKSCGSTNSTLALQFDDSGTTLNCSTTTSQIIIPASALSAFNGENAQGNWTFRVRDAVLGMLGTINSASVNICNKTFTLSNTDFENIDFALYPNPNKGLFTIQCKRDTLKEIKVYVHDILGKYVYSNTFSGSGYFIQDIQLTNVPAGVYLVTVTDGEKRTVRKILIN